MPFSYHIDEERDLIVIEAEGPVSPEGLEVIFREYSSLPGFHADIDVLVEVGDDISVEVDGQTVRPVDLVKEDAMKGPEAELKRVRGRQSYRVACVGGSPEIRTFFAAGIDLVNADRAFETFDTREAALQWLGRA